MPQLPRLAFAAALLTLFAACGTATSGTPRPPAGVTTVRDDVAATDLGTEVVGVRTAGRDRLALTLVTDYDDGRCYLRPRARQERERRILFVTTSFDAVPEGSPDCLAKPTDEFEVRAPGLHRLERVATDSSKVWERGEDDAWVECSPVVGCDPPADRCAPAWVNTLTHGVELPPERQVDVLACTTPWLVADVDAVVTGCQSLDGSTPSAGCEDSGVHRRWFAHWDGEIWDVVVSGTAAGCADVAEIADFPQRLCADLPAR